MKLLLKSQLSLLNMKKVNHIKLFKNSESSDYQTIISLKNNPEFILKSESQKLQDINTDSYENKMGIKLFY